MRDGDGLALATANRDLTREERAIAPRLYATLGEIARENGAGGATTPLCEREGARCSRRPASATEYFAIRQAADLSPVGATARELVILAAARLHAEPACDNLRVNLIERH